MSAEPVFLNDLEYSSTDLDPFDSLRRTITFSADDWGQSRAMAWVWGVAVGWDLADDAELRAEFAETFGWTDETMARLEALHAAFEAAAGRSL